MQKEIYFAGGCFWGTQKFFSMVDGVSATETGYANGDPSFGGRPSYEEVYTDKTGFAETVRVCYDPARTGLEDLVRLFFTTIDPYSLNRQGGDCGTRYRTGVYYTSEEERAPLEMLFDRIAGELGGGRPAVELEVLKSFWPAEEYHQKYLEKNEGGYCHIPLKTFAYLRLFQDLKALLGDEPDPVARMSNTAALIRERFGFHWVGFYLVRGEELVVGPFQGPVACFRIPFGKGVCGTAWKEGRTVVVPDVDEFPGHIACSSHSRSEIVVPLRARDEKICAVLDIDGAEKGMFDATDALWLGKVAGIIL